MTAASELISPVIDFHVHPPLFEWASPLAEELIKKVTGLSIEECAALYSNPDHFTGLLDQWKVDYVVLLAEYSPGVSGVVTNEQVARFSQHSKRFIPFCNINPNLVSNPVKELERWVLNLKCRGLKLLPSYQQWHPLEARVYPLYAAAQEIGIPVLFHTGSSIFPGTRLRYADPLFLDDLAIDFPRLKIIQAHSGRGFWYDRAFFLTRLHENVYMEISGLPPKNLLKYFPELEKNADKIIFGSDWPAGRDPAKMITEITALPLREATKKKILGGNAAEILKLKGELKGEL